MNEEDTKNKETTPETDTPVANTDGASTSSRTVHVPASPLTAISTVLNNLKTSQTKTGIPEFTPGDSIKVHAKIIEGTKERIQIFQGVVIRRKGGNSPEATFTVRKISYDVGVERTFFLHSPRIDKIEVVSHGQVRRSRLYYLRDLRGKASRIKADLAKNNAAAAANTEEESETKKTNGSNSDHKQESLAAAPAL